jgi:regulator of sigma E protease
MISFIIILSILIFVHEFGHFLIARKKGVRVEKFSLGFGPPLLTFKKNQTQYLIGAIPLGGYVKMAGEDFHEELCGESWEYLTRSCGVRAAIVFAGPLLNYILALLVFSLIFIIGSPMPTSKVGAVVEGYPAKEVGILSGDKIIAVEGIDVNYWEDLVRIIHKKTKGDISLSVLRDNHRLNFKLTPRIEEITDLLGQKRTVARIGITPSDEVVTVKYNPFVSVYLGTKKLGALTALTYHALGNILTGKLSIRQSVTGPIGIFYITTKISKLGFVYFLHILGVISASLAIFNLLPIPVLDGGHILFLGIEKLRGRPLNPKVQEFILKLAMTLLILMAILICYNDLIRFGYWEKAVGWWKRS